MTPIVKDSATSGTNKTPTFAVLFPMLCESVSTNSQFQGVTSNELDGINFLSNLSDEQAKHLSSLIFRSVGGASVGVKVSTGDNDTLSKIISTICEEVLRRKVENTTYNLFEEFRYHAKGANLVPDYDENQKHLRLSHLDQDMITLFLQTQNDINTVLNNGTKPH